MGPATRSLTATLGLVAAASVGCAPDPPVAAVAVTVDGRCRNVTEHGAGILLDNGLILTSAHVVGGASEISTRMGGDDSTATIVAFDADNDLAYLKPAKANEHGWQLATADQLDEISRGSAASVYVVRDGEMTRLDATIVRRVEIDTEDIYIDVDVTRPGWEIRYPIESGDSGGAVTVNGAVIGVVWAKSRVAADRAYAIDPVLGGDLIRRQLATRPTASSPTESPPADDDGIAAVGGLLDRDGAPIDVGRC